MKTIRRMILIGLFLAIALTGIGGQALCEDVVYWVNPNGGRYYHLDQNCKIINAKFLPLGGQFTYGEIGNEPYSKLKPCNVCGAPLPPE